MGNLSLLVQVLLVCYLARHWQIGYTLQRSLGASLPMRSWTQEIVFGAMERLTELELTLAWTMM